MKQSKNIRIIALIYFLLLYAMWACLECIIVPKLNLQTLPVSFDVIKEIGSKMLLWFIPSLFLILRHSDSMFIPKNEILGDTKETDTYIPMCFFILLFTAWFLIPNYLKYGTIRFSPSFHAIDILIYISVGITEEMFFRGFLLNTALKDRNQWIVFLGNAVMFLMIHFPIWFRKGLFTTYMTNFAFLQLIGLSLIFSWTFVKSRSIIVPIILHAYWDLLCTAIE
ncbi:CPBP family intramembrane glutamic endopeptidase [Ruminococcus albus]|uniref:CAAX prenyl protease 2/Lysostaphin resistance protein A-like domain-containing protein n=1 Tax=Ruminococcus albus TaxID=1264 RepID=A0A1H7KRW2_RUMAL|nr:CPBP family intramembrane glutamic endopeptidase [Ruminococcus albus]SEK89488.1 hypothetical protein SAMN05216469_10776 [Ruminococcus albus]